MTQLHNLFFFFSTGQQVVETSQKTLWMDWVKEYWSGKKKFVPITGNLIQCPIDI